ncbi:MAG: glycosyltransferase family protein [Bacteroidales bacterium]|jgi:glycosyltransferase involved in cell wall biosynthesis
MNYPKVFIFGQPFNNFSGGGITLTNLFKGWDKNKIAVAYLGHGLYNVTTDVCDTVYQLGQEEYKWIFPFNLLQRKFPSGLKKFNPDKKPSFFLIDRGIRFKIVNRIFYPFLRWIGLYHCLSRIYLSTRLKDWLNDYKPDILYLQVSTREDIHFSIDLINLLKIPSVIHIMDDWPTTICNGSIFKKYWQKKIDGELKSLMNLVDLHLSISDSMSEEYSRRYNKQFIAFHNPIETEKWLPYSKKDYVIKNDKVVILYSGRIGMGIKESIYEVAAAIDKIDRSEFNIRLHIQTPTRNESVLNQLKKFRCIVINPFVSLDQLPKIFSEADLLLLANDFSPHGADYLKFSMPTKASEYMISGTPIFAYSPEEAAVSKFFNTYECAYCVHKQDQTEIIKAVKFMLSNEDYRKKIGSKAVEVAKENFSALKVRAEFQSLLIKSVKD